MHRPTRGQAIKDKRSTIHQLVPTLHPAAHQLKLGAGADEHGGHGLELALPHKLQAQHAVLVVHHLARVAAGRSGFRDRRDGVQGS
jgi:hypothetical protein